LTDIIGKDCQRSLHDRALPLGDYGAATWKIPLEPFN